jgi:hypothetical protein
MAKRRSSSLDAKACEDWSHETSGSPASVGYVDRINCVSCPDRSHDMLGAGLCESGGKKFKFSANMKRVDKVSKNLCSFCDEERENSIAGSAPLFMDPIDRPGVEISSPFMQPSCFPAPVG